MEVRYWKPLERHPLSAEYADLRGNDRKELLDGIKEKGFDKRKPIVLARDEADDGKMKILEGWQRQTVCVELDIKPNYIPLPRGYTQEEFVAQENDHRRHESEQAKEKRLAARRERVAALREEGKSIREIADEEDVSKTTIERDIEEISSGVPGGTPEPESGKVTGKDGKEYPASKPEPIRCESCKRKIRVGIVLPKGCQQCKELRGEQTDKKKRDPKPDTAPKDRFGVEIPKKCRAAYADPWIPETIAFLRELEKNIRGKRVADGMKKRASHYPFMVEKDFVDGIGFVMNGLDDLIGHLEANGPAGVCPSCDGAGCASCKLSGLVPEEIHKKLSKKK